MRQDDRGVTLVELIVVLGLMSVVAAIAGGVLYNSINATTRATNDVSAEREALIALRRLSQDVRAANPVLAAYPPTSPSTACATGSYPGGYSNCLHFLITKNELSPTTCTVDGKDVPSPYTRVAVGLRGGRVLMDRTEYSSTCSVLSSRVGIIVMEDVVNTATEPLFEYFKKTGDPIAAGVSPLTAQAGSVKIRLRVQYQKQNNAPVLDLASFAAFRNAR